MGDIKLIINRPVYVLRIYLLFSSNVFEKVSRFNPSSAGNLKILCTEKNAFR